MINLNLFHGSDKIIRTEDIDLNGSNKNYDFGGGFYMTENSDIAEEWAVRRDYKYPVVNQFLLDLDRVSALDLNSEDWLHIVLNNRFGFGKVVFSSDVVCGLIADDALYNVIEDFRRGIINSNQVYNCLVSVKLGKQYCLKNNIDALKFVKSYRVGGIDRIQSRANNRRFLMDSKITEIYRNKSIDGLYFEDFINKGDFYEHGNSK